MPLSQVDIADEYKRHFERFLEEWKNYLSFPSVSSLPEHENDCRDCAKWLVEHFKSIGLESRLIQTGSLPSVYAEWKGEPDAPTIIVYGHLDVQPIGDRNRWNYSPFGGTVENGRIYGRGTRDNKGQHFFLIKAVETLIKQGNLRCSVKFLIDGEEESGSEGLMRIYKDLGEELRGDILLSCETAGSANGDPAIIVGLRGAVYSRLRFHGASKELHSGNHGGRVRNPAFEAAYLLGSLIDSSGKVAIEGFYDDVVEPTPHERAIANAMPFDENEYLGSIGVSALSGEPEYSALERIGFRPSLEINGFSSGHTGDGVKTSIPTHADAVVSMRIVPNQDPHDIMAKLRKHLYSRVHEGVRIEELPPQFRVIPLKCDLESEPIAHAKKILNSFSKEETQLMWAGASLPLIHVVVEQYALQPLLVGFGMAEDNEHGLNESFSLDQFRKGFMFGCLFFQNMRPKS